MTRNNIPASASGNREFDLHLHVLEHRCEGRAPRYTIGVWEQTTQGAGLRAICHIRSLPGALLAITGELDKGTRPESVEITYPRWSDIAELVKRLHHRADTDCNSAADMLEDLHARLHNTIAELELTLERLAKLGTLVEEAAAKSQVVGAQDGCPKTMGLPQSVWFRLLAVYRDKQEGCRVYQELQALREVAGITAETLRTIDNWLGSASTREAAMEALWRLRRILEALGYTMPLEHLAWRGQIIRAMEEAGLGLGADGAIRFRQPQDKYWEPATGALVKEVLENAGQPIT